MSQHIRSRSTNNNTTERINEITNSEWMEKLSNVHVHRADMNNLIMDYLVTEGFKEAAEKFRTESGINPGDELNSMDNRIRIRDAVQNGQIQEAIDIVNELYPELLDQERYLFFHLQQQKLIELIRERNIEEALKYAQEKLAERGLESDTVLNELERTVALLAFDEPEKSPFGDLLSTSHRQKVASELNAAILSTENRKSTQPKLAMLLKMLLWSQEELNKKKIKYPRMVDLAYGSLEEK